MHAVVSALVAALFCSLVAAAATDSSLNALAKSCRFTLNNQRFDLCPVLETNGTGWTVGFERQTPPTITKTEYKISLQGPLKKSRKVPSHEQCPDGTWICLTVTNARPKHEDEDPRVLQVVPVAGQLSFPKEGDDLDAEEYQPGVNVSMKLVPANKQTKHDILHVHLHGGYYTSKQQKADFQFVCDHEAEEPTSPTALWNWNGTHTFRWRTKQACGKALSRPDPTPDPPQKAPADDPDADAPPKDAEDDDTPGDERKLLDPDLLGGRSRRSMMTLFASSASLIFLLMYLVYFPPHRVRQAMTSYAKTHPWLLRSRVGERVLIRWAHEDFGVEGAEEDTMVNGNREFEGIAMDEQIPLKPSPRLQVTANYGSA